MDEKLGICGEVTAILIDKDGHIKSVSKHHNLILERGITYLFQRMFSRLTNYTFTDTLVTYSPTINPFAYMLVGWSDSGGGTPYAPVYTESNEQTNGNVETIFQSRSVSANRISSLIKIFGLNDTFDYTFPIDFKTGGDAKVYDYVCNEYFQEWNVLNTANATTFNTNVTNAGDLTIVLNTNSSTILDTAFTAPFLYVYCDDYIDVETNITHSPSTNDQAGICLRDGPAATQNNVFICNKNGAIVVGSTDDGTTTIYDHANNHNYLRITRSGGTFTFYSKSLVGDSWTQQEQLTRSDMATTDLQVGVFSSSTSGAGTYTARFPYFKLNSTGGPVINDVVCDFYGGDFANNPNADPVNTVGFGTRAVGVGGSDYPQVAMQWGSRVNITEVEVGSTDTLRLIYRIKLTL
jgi:hypothetical protein